MLRELNGTHIRNSMLSGKSIGRKESVCGQIGVISIAGISGCTSDPPAESYTMKSRNEMTEQWLVSAKNEKTYYQNQLAEYAVDPVGVAIVSPSAWTVVMWCSSPRLSLVNGDLDNST